MTAAYPELGPPLERRSPPGGMVLDGTLVARGQEARAAGPALKRRSARFNPGAEHIRAVPIDFQVADLGWTGTARWGCPTGIGARCWRGSGSRTRRSGPRPRCRCPS